MKVGDIYMVEIPPSDGREQAGLRPAIVVQSTSFTDQLPTVCVVPLTSQVAAQRFPGTFSIEPDSDNRLKATSIALVFQLRAIDKRRIRRRLGKLKQTHNQQLGEQIKLLLNFD